MPTTRRSALPLERFTQQRLSGGEVALDLQQRAEVVDGSERARMPVAEGLAQPLQRLAAQRLSGGEVALGLQQRAEVADGDERVRMQVAEHLACHLHRLAAQQLSGGEVALLPQQPAQVVDRFERARMPIAERLAFCLKQLAAQRLGLVELALGLQLLSEPRRGTRPCTGRSGRLSPPLGPCAAIARGRLCGSTWRSRGRRTAARAGRRLHPPSTAGTSSPPLTCRLSEGALRCATARAALQALLQRNRASPPKICSARNARSWADTGAVRAEHAY
eukprot:scaffold112667_cov73-Phaeocystis_antarctica.AAC.4